MAGYVSKVLGYCEGYDYDGFVADSKLVEACVFNLNRIVHDYEGVNLRLVWEIISEDLPEVQRILDRIIR